MATKFAGQYVQSFLNIMKMQFGVEMMVFGGYLDNKDAINTFRCVVLHRILISCYKIDFREQTTPTLPVESFMKIQKKPIADLFESWKDFCQDKITEHIQDEDDNDEQGSSSLVPAKTQDKGMPRILPVDNAGHCVLPELNSRFKAAVPGFVRQEMLRSWLTYWYSMFLPSSCRLDVLNQVSYQGRQLADRRLPFPGLNSHLTLRSLLIQLALLTL